MVCVLVNVAMLEISAISVQVVILEIYAVNVQVDIKKIKVENAQVVIEILFQLLFYYYCFNFSKLVVVTNMDQMVSIATHHVSVTAKETSKD